MENDEDELIDDELIEYLEKYKKETARLLTRIEQREELIGLLKIAKPEKIAGLREIISRMDRSIESTEKIIAMSEEIIQKKREHLENLRELSITSDQIIKELREYFPDQPEKLELIEALMEDNGESH